MHYLDYAATSAVRPDVVTQAICHFLDEVGASPGRGGYRRSVESGRTCFRCRRRLAGLLGAEGDPGRVAFMMNATQGLNVAMFGILDPGSAVVITPYDHNAVLRPAYALSRHRNVEVRMTPGAPDGSMDMQALSGLLDGARLLVVNAASNVLGTRLPLAEMARLAHDAGALVLVDAAQSLGHLAERPAAEGADLVAFTGHKGLLGPQGIGGLWVREGIDLEPLITGGTGGRSDLREMPSSFPDRLEAGTPNAPGIAGLLAGMEFVEEQGIAGMHAHEAGLKARLRDGLEQIPGIRVLSPAAPEGTGVVTIACDRIDPATLSRRLEEEWSVMCRPGLHCAPEAHRLLGTLETGALRFSLGWASTEEDVDQALSGVEAIAGPTRVGPGTPVEA
jgi:cysteine desulfurase / selenocysteine lyase